VKPSVSDHFAPSKCIYTASDAQEQAENLVNWQQCYDQISAGAFSGVIEELPFEDLQVFKETTSQSLRQQCKVRADAIWLGLPVRSSQDFFPRINGLEVSENQLMCQPGAVDFELVTPDDFQIYGVVISTSTLRKAAESLGLTVPEISDAQAKVCITHQQEVRLSQHIELLLALQDQKGISSIPAAIQTERFIQTLLDILTIPDYDKSVPQSYEQRKRVIETVKAYIDANPDKAMTISELCETAHVSRRTLQYSFESQLGISPLQFIKMRRLNQVRRDLLNAETGAKISDIAIQRGFWHPGQFGRDYQKLFGELPSKTLARSVRRP